jgi:hypothetical protein
MNRIIRLILLFDTIIFISTPLLDAQSIDPGNRIQIIVNARVSKAPTQPFQFSYVVHSLAQSQQTVKQFDIIFRPRNDSIQQLSSALGWEPPGIATGTGWPFNLIDWWAQIPNQIQPGNSASGFAYKTFQLPGICVFYAEGNHALPWSEEGMASDSIPGYTDLTPYGPGIIGTTVGSVETLSSLGPLTLLDSLSSYVLQSRSLGWIVTQETADKYNNYFSTVRSQLSSANIVGGLSSLQSVLVSANADSTALLTPEAYALMRFNSEFLSARLQPSFKLKGGIFNLPGTSTLSVRTIPSVTFTSSDTLIALTATVRWQSRYTLTLGTVSSPTYGFSKYGTVVTVGNYNYQQFRSTTHVPLNWTANTEYELFTVPVNGSAGVEDFTLTNALSGGQWFVDINYLDKTDSVFYQRVATCTGLTSQNKSDDGWTTAYNGARHLAMTSTKLHEVYGSGGGIVYRRKSLTGSWEVTQRISFDSLGAQNDPCITIAHDGSVHVVWQQLLTSTTFALWYNRSTDGGTTWGTPTTITGASNVSINQNQWNIYPVLAEYGTTQIVVVCCYSGGLEYNTSSNLGQSWNNNMTSTGAQGGSGYQGYIWYPSLAGLSFSGYNKIILTYDSRYNGVWSQIYDGNSWSTEASASTGLGTYFDRFSSIGFDIDGGVLYGSWCAQGPTLQEYGIVGRVGTFYNTWGSQFVLFPVVLGSGVSELYPSITGGEDYGGTRNIDIICANTSNQIKLFQYSQSGGGWRSPRVLSSSGQWANTTLWDGATIPTYPIRLWTDQSGNPHQVTLQSDGNYSLQKTQGQGASPYDLHRRIVIESQRARSTIWFDLAPLKIVTAANDTVVVPFKQLEMTKPFTATLANAWDYLGTDQITLPTNARSLILETDIRSQARQDTLDKAGTNVFTTSSFRFDGVKTSQTIPLLSNQPGVPGRKIIDVSQQAGQAIILRMIGTIPATSTEPVTIGVGDVYISRKP